MGVMFELVERKKVDTYRTTCLKCQAATVMIATKITKGFDWDLGFIATEKSINYHLECGCPFLNEMQLLHETLNELLPADIVIRLDFPLIEGGVWALDIFSPKLHLPVIWKQDKGFGLVVSQNHCYGEGAEEVYSTIGEVVARIVDLLGININE